MEEIWKDIAGYEGLYLISNLGRVKSLPKKCGRTISKELILSPAIDRKGYLFVNITKDGVPKNRSIHRLIAIAFISNPENKPQIDHADGNPLNNSFSNLIWSTQKENLNNKVFKERSSLSHKGQIPGNRKIVIQKSLTGEIINTFPSLLSAELFTGIDKRKIKKSFQNNQFILFTKQSKL